MMEIAEVEEIFAYAKKKGWVNACQISITKCVAPRAALKQWPVAPFVAIDYYVDFLYCDNLYASEKLSEMTVDVLFEKMEVFIFTWSDIMKDYEEWKKSVIREWRISRLLD